MKSIPSYFAIASLLALFLLVFCGKKDADQLTPEILLGKWNMVNAEFNDHVSGTDHKDSSTFKAGELNIEFKNNGTVISSSPFHADTMTYKILDANCVLIADDTLKIKPLTNTSIQIYFRNKKNSTGDYYEEWDRLKK